MWNTKLQAIILAAGQAKRFRTGRSKLVEPLCGRPMILYATAMLEGLDIETTLVVGHQRDDLQKIATLQHGNRITFAHQEQQLGTGHALLCSQKFWSKENILILNGDMPLINPQIIEQLYTEHHKQNATVSFVVSHLEHPGHSYGRVVEKNGTIKIVEAKDFEGDPTAHCWINAGMYLVSKQFLEKNIDRIERSNVSQEFYLTDLIGMASEQGCNVTTVPAPFDHIRGINTLEELWAAEQVKRAELIRYWMTQGVRFMKAQNVHLDITVTIGAGSCISGGVYLIGNTTIGKNCTIGEYTRLENATIGDNAVVRSHCVITDSTLCQNVNVGPFAHLRSGTVIEQNASIGNFVEIKKSVVGKKSSARHLTYLGDATVGKNVNIGAGTITCNHNGITKEKTIIKDGACIGSNNTLVAPITVEQDSLTAAGSTITENVPENTVAFGRARQVNKEGYAPKLRTKLEEKFANKKTKKQRDSCCKNMNLTTKKKKKIEQSA